MNMKLESGSRILVVDDNRLIHDDFRKILCDDHTDHQAIDELESQMFGVEVVAPRQRYEVDSAFQGYEAVEMTRRAMAAGRPYRLAFIDMRMPPGLDGLQSMIQLKALDPNLQFVVCSAYSDYDPHEVCQQLGMQGSLLHLAKPFSPDDIRQLAFILAGEVDAAHR